MVIKHFCNYRTSPKVSLLWRSGGGLCGQMILKAVLAVVMLVVWHHVPDRSKVVTQTKWGTLVLQVGGWAWGWKSHPIKYEKCKPLLLSYPQPSWFIVKNDWQGHNENHCSVFHRSGLTKFHPWSCTGF